MIPFATAIIRSTGKYTNGVTRTSDAWKSYVSAILSKIERDLQDIPSDLESKYDDAREQINNLSNDWEEFANAFEAAETYRLMANAYVEGMSQTVAYSMFGDSKVGQGDGRQDYRLESYLVSADNRFMHPNAIRYLLIKILDLMKAQKESVDKEKSDSKEYFESFEKNTFDITETEDVEETVDDLADRKVSLVAKLTKRPTGEQEEIKRKFKVFLDNIENYQVQYTQSYVLGRGIDYITKLIDAFESFYKSFDSKVETLERSIRNIYKKYSDSKGTTVRYVCASKNCMDRICEKKPYTGSTISIDSDLAKEIYEKILSYAQKEDKPNNNRYFSDLFDKGIIGYFEGIVMRDYGSDLDVDIITAIENEADYEGLYEEEDDAYDLIDRYVRKTIEDTRKLSCPFIESPMGEAREPINSCTFNIALRPERGDESPRAQLIRKELMNFGGEPDEDIDKNMIMFYQSFYGLRANDLSKFAPPERSITYNRSSGEYFKAYYELISGIHPESHRSKEISPHIDRWWHIITKMPDLDEENQKRQEYNIYAAFFWAIINRYVYLTEEGSDTKLYKLRNILLNMDSDSLTVSNGTECDKLYEVLDALAIYPELIEKILDKVRTLTENDINENNSIENGMLFSALRTFSIEEPGVGEENLASSNIFDIPMLMKKSSTPDIYYEANVTEMLQTELEEIKRYLANFCTKKELPEVMGKLIMDQFAGHLESVALESKIHPSVYRESLFDKTCDIITKALMELGKRKEAQQIQEKVAELRKC